MTGPDPESFKRALARFKATLDPSLQQQFATCTLTDVHQIIKGLQDKQIRDDNLRALGRLQAFVEVMDQFGQVIEVFLNANVFVCFIWVRSLPTFPSAIAKYLMRALLNFSSLWVLGQRSQADETYIGNRQQKRSSTSSTS